MRGKWRASVGTIATVATVLVLFGAFSGLGYGHASNFASAGPARIGSVGSPWHGSTALVPGPSAAALTLTPTSGDVGSTITANATGFTPGAFANATWGAITLCGGQTNATTGDLACNFTVPADVHGAHTVTMKDSSSVTASATFTVNASISLDPMQGGPGTVVAVSGTGYAATSTWTVAWAGVPAITCTGAATKTDAVGNFSCRFTVTATTTGAHVVTATDAAANSATASFLVPVPALSFYPAAYGTVGSMVFVNGTGFTGSSSYGTFYAWVDWAPSGLTWCAPATTSDGNFSCAVAVPDDVGGAHTITATDMMGDSATATFTINASLVLTPGNAAPGATVTAIGSGFGALAAATVTWAPGAVTLCTANTSATGDFSCTFAVPSGALGAHTVTGDAVLTATATFTLDGAVPSISIAYTNAFSLYMSLNLSLAWTITADQPINTQTTTMSLTVTDLGSSACPYIASHPTRVVKAPCTVVTLPLNYLLVNGTSSYSLVLTLANMTSGGYNKGNLPYDTGYVITIAVSIANSGSVGTGTVASPTIFLTSHPAAATIVSPDPLSGVPTGNVSIVVAYDGDFISGAVVSIYTSGSSPALVFSSGVAVPGSGARVGSAGSPWTVAKPGTYDAQVNLSGAWGYKLFTTTLTVFAAGGGIVYVNQSSYQNSSLIPGLSNGVTGMLLLLVGAIIGLIVALALGRMMWSSAAPKPAQPWQGKPNECSVCHQAFDNEADLKDHQKKAHGMG